MRDHWTKAACITPGCNNLVEDNALHCKECIENMRKTPTPGKVLKSCVTIISMVDVAAMSHTKGEGLSVRFRATDYFHGFSVSDKQADECVKAYEAYLQTGRGSILKLVYEYEEVERGPMPMMLMKG